MFKISNPRRLGVVTLHVLFILCVLAASAVSLASPQCRERTTELTLDGISSGIVIAAVQLLNLVWRRKGNHSGFSLYCAARLLVSHHVRYGIAGGYTYGVTLAAISCLSG